MLEKFQGDTALIRDDAAGFAAAIEAVERDDALWARLSRAGRAHAAQRFGPAALDDALEELLDRPRGRRVRRSGPPASRR